MRSRQRLSAFFATVIVVLLLCAGFALAMTFSDVHPGDDYYEAITALSDKGIITGKDDGTFRPRELVTRQQFAKMVVLTLGLPVSDADVCPFGDVQIGGYPDPYFPDNYIAVAASRGITKGVSSTNFSPYDSISRAQVMSMVVRSAPLAGISLRTPGDAYYGDSRYTQRFFDDPNHGLNSQIAELNGLLWGIRTDAVGVWDPWKKATRGEVAQILYRLRQKIESPATTTTTTESPSDLLYYEDFSDPESGWPITYEPDYETGYMYGSYYISLYVQYGFTWAAAGDPYADVIVAVDATPDESEGSWEYGVVFGLQDDGDFFQLSVLGDGTAKLWHFTGGDWVQISEPVALPMVSIDGTRELVISTSGNTIAAWVDNAMLGPVEDPGLAPGRLGVCVGTFDTSYMNVFFDDFTVWSND